MIWTPPDAPVPLEILSSAASDTRNGSHAQALAKFLWFHHNALRLDSAQYGVRLSFALSAWMALADAYPPARAEFIRTRDETEAAFRKDHPFRFELFHDLASMNEKLGDGARTANLFVDTAREDHAAAASLYRVAEPFLIAVGRYDACGQFLDPPTRLSLAANLYEIKRGMEVAEPAGPPLLARDFYIHLARYCYIHDVATLVGLLALNRRLDEAGRAREEVLAVLDDEEFRTLLDNAMTGHLPPPRFG